MFDHTPFVCDFCLSTIAPTPATLGYGTCEDGKRACFACCGWLDIIAMRDGKDVGLYVSGGKVSNWPGTLSLPILRSRKGRHNMTGSRTTHHFPGPDGTTWTGTEYHGPCSGGLLRGVRRLARAS